MAEFNFKTLTPITTGVTSAYFLFGAASQVAATPEIYTVGAAVGSSTATFTNKTFDTAGTGNSFSINGLAATANTGTGAVARASSPAFTTPTLGAATATSINGLTITSSTGTLTLTNGKTLSVSNTLTFTGTDSSSVAFGAGGTVLYTASTIPLTVGSTTIASGTNTRILYNNSGVLGEYTLTGTGTVVVMQTAPTFATSITAPSVLATANDSGALGASGTAFADLFLASGGVINWAAANATITHSSGLLTFNVPITLGTSNSFTCGTIELGAASDTTISRSEAGVIAVEGVPLYSNIPVNSQSTAYSTVLADAQKQILHPTADNNARTFTIDGAVSYPVGSAITFVNQINTVTIAISTDTLVFAGVGTTGSRSLGASGIATAVKIASGTWLISGTGLT